MIKVLTDLVQFLLSCAPLLTSLAFFTVFSILLSKSIKRHPGVWYTVFALPFLMVAVPTVLRWCGVETFSFTRVPVLGQILRDYIHMGTFGHPLLIVIMYMGALDTRHPYVKRLMSIRKELSIISGFPILTHSLIRVANNFPRSLKYFTDHAAFMENSTAQSQLGVGISSFSFVLGIVMLALFIPLWVTSFDGVHRRMGNLRWKKFQRWSYVFYATLFIHSMGIQVGGMLNPRGAAQPQKPAVENVAAQTPGRGGQEPDRAGRHEISADPADSVGAADRAAGEPEVRTGQNRLREGEYPDRGVRQTPDPNVSAPGEARQEQAQGQNPSPKAEPSNRRAQAKGLGDIKLSARTRSWIGIASLILIYGSYLFLRVGKARRNKRKKAEAARK